MLQICPICLAGGIRNFYWLLARIPPAAADGSDLLAAPRAPLDQGFYMRARAHSK